MAWPRKGEGNGAVQIITNIHGKHITNAKFNKAADKQISCVNNRQKQHKTIFNGCKWNVEAVDEQQNAPFEK